MMRRLMAIIRKEFSQTLRERGTLIIMLSMPLLQLILFGYAINMNVRHIPMALVDQSLDPASRAYTDDMLNSGYFDLVASVGGQAEAERLIDQNTARVAIIIPPQFSEHVQKGDARVLVLVDGSEHFTALSAYNAANIIGQAHAARAMLQSMQRAGLNPPADALTTHLDILYN